MSEDSLEDLKEAVQLACQPTSSKLIAEGRAKVKSFPRAWVAANLEEVAVEGLDLTDYWEYRRLLELVKELDAPELLVRLAGRGKDSPDDDIREASTDFS